MRASSGRALLTGACLALVAVAAGCGGSDSTQELPPGASISMVVGDILPLSGPHAGLGLSGQKAAQLAVEEVNDAIGEADVDHTLEIVHKDAVALGPGKAMRSLLAAGAGCVIGPGARSAARRSAVARGTRGRAVLIFPGPGAGREPPPPGRLNRPGGVVVLPPPGPPAALSSAPRSERDPAAAFADLYSSTDPPIGPPRTGDGRRFDAVVLCYLAAVATGGEISSMPPRIRAPLRGARRLTWEQLAEAIPLLQAGTRINYVGVTGTFGIAPSRST